MALGFSSPDKNTPRKNNDTYNKHEPGSREQTHKQPKAACFKKPSGANKQSGAFHRWVNRQKSITQKVRAQILVQGGNSEYENDAAFNKRESDLHGQRQKFDRLCDSYENAYQELKVALQEKAIASLAEEPQIPNPIAEENIQKLKNNYLRIQTQMRHLQTKYANDSVDMMDHYIQVNKTLGNFRENFEGSLVEALRLRDPAWAGEAVAMPASPISGSAGKSSKEKRTSFIEAIRSRNLGKGKEKASELPSHKLFPEGQEDPLIRALGRAVTLSRQGDLDPSLVGNKGEPANEANFAKDAEDLAQTLIRHFFDGDAQTRLETHLAKQRDLDAQAGQGTLHQAPDNAASLAFLLEDYCLRSADSQEVEEKPSLANRLRGRTSWVGMEVKDRPLAFIPHYFDIKRETQIGMQVADKVEEDAQKVISALKQKNDDLKVEKEEINDALKESEKEREEMAQRIEELLQLYSQPPA